MSNVRKIKSKRKDKVSAKRKARKHAAKSGAAPGHSKRIHSHSPRQHSDGLYESMPSPTLPEGDPYD